MAQDFYYLNKSDGLPSNTVYHVLQTRDKYLWFATEMGIVRYDGHNIVVFDKGNGLACSENFELIQNKTGSLFSLGENGVISTRKGQGFAGLRKLRFSTFISEYLETSDGRVVASSFGDGVKILKAGKVLSITQNEGLPDNQVSYIWEKGEDVYAISTLGISKILPNNQIKVIHRFKQRIHFSRAVKTTNGDVILSVKENLYRLDKSDRLIKLSNSSALTRNTLFKLQEIDGQMVASTHKGAFFFTIEKDSIVKQIDKEEGVTQEEKDSIVNAEEGLLIESQTSEEEDN